MKNSNKLTIAFLLLCPLSNMSYAAEPQKTAEPTQKPAESMPGMGMQHPGMGMGGMGMGGMGMMSGMTEEEKDQHLRAQQDYMLQMHDMSNQILAEKDPAKKEQLKNKQLEFMKAHREKMMSVHHPMK